MKITLVKQVALILCDIGRHDLVKATDNVVRCKRCGMWAIKNEADEWKALE